MDCLRTALRAGAKSAVCLYRRDFANMPGSRKEYYNALEEGADFQFLTNPPRSSPTSPAESAPSAACAWNSARPTPRAGANRAPSRTRNSTPPSTSCWSPTASIPSAFPGTANLSADRGHRVGRRCVVDRNQMTSLPGVFAGGDSARGPSLVVHAVRDARRAAAGIHRYLAPKLAPRPCRVTPRAAPGGEPRALEVSCSGQNLEDGG